jgi:peptidoglycan hydrolase CwlO-like protein
MKHQSSLGKALVWAYLPVMLTLLVVFTTAARADDLQDQINAATQSLNEHVAKRDTLMGEGKALVTRKDNNDFAYSALVKQAPIVSQEIDQIGAHQKAIDSKYDALKEQVADLQAAGNKHNSISCTEKCTQGGGCDGSCAWYTAEKNQLESRQAQLNTEIESVNSENANLDTQRQTVKQSAQDLVEIQTKCESEAAAIQAAAQQLTAEWDENERQIQVYANTIKRLQQIKDANDSCMRSIPSECDSPNTPALVTKCEQMHASCGKMFDGNR